ncbi:MAG: cache domain-containing protein, partial [Lachnospiraceae bacterium]|nr:cache domain-containing protein [Lachnospiraceae bacterium]
MSRIRTNLKNGNKSFLRKKADQSASANVVKSSKAKVFWEFLFISLLPMAVLGLVITIYSTYTLRNGLQERTFESLKAVGETTLASINTVYTGGWTLSPDGIVMKGDTVMTDNNLVFINVKKKSNMDVTLYYKGKLTATSLAIDHEFTEEEKILMSQGVKVYTDFVGLEPDEKLTKDVMETGKDATYTSFDFNDVNCYAYCLPILNSTGVAQGMILVTLDKPDVTKYI